LPRRADMLRDHRHVSKVPILLQKSKIERDLPLPISSS
jgi:hypothetical protein